MTVLCVCMFSLSGIGTRDYRQFSELALWHSCIPQPNRKQWLTEHLLNSSRTRLLKFYLLKSRQSVELYCHASKAVVMPPEVKLGGGIPPDLRSGTSYLRCTTSNNRSCTSQLRSSTFFHVCTVYIWVFFWMHDVLKKSVVLCGHFVICICPCLV